MEAIISKELLSEILDKKVVVDDISNIELKENTITFIEDYWDEDEGSGFYRNHTINIYELAHKCKEWALNQEIDKSPKENIFKFKVLYKMDIETYKHPIEDGYSSMINPLKYGNSVNLNTFGICLNSYDSTIVNNTFESLVFYAPTEPEAIFKACQWILNQKDSHAN